MRVLATLLLIGIGLGTPAFAQGPIVGDVPTIDALRGLAAGQYQVATLYGKNAIGDMGAPRSYLWQTGTCLAPDNMQQILPRSGTGCWVLLSNAGARAVTSFGVVPDNVTDNSVALQAAFTWLGQQCSASLILPPGTIFSSTKITWTIAPSCSGSVLGQGGDVSGWRTPAGVSLLQITEDGVTNQSFHIRDFTCLAGGTALVSPATCISAVNGGHFVASAQSDVSNVTFRGSDGYGNVPSQVNCWASGFFTDSISNINFINDNFSGCHSSSGEALNGASGIVLFGSATASIIYNISICNFSFLQNGIFYGENIQGVSISQSNFTPDGYGVYAPASDGFPYGLNIATSQFGYLLYGVYDGVSYLPEIVFTGNQVGGGVIEVIYITNALNDAFTGNTFRDLGELGSPPGSGEHALTIVASDGTPTTIIGNTLNGYDAYNVVPISLGASTSNIQVASNGTPNSHPKVASASALNFVTGNQIAFGLVTGAADNGVGLTRLTLTDATLFHNSDVVLTAGVGGTVVAYPVTSNIQVIDAHTIDLLQVLWSGTFTGGGRVTWLP